VWDERGGVRNLHTEVAQAEGVKQVCWTDAYNEVETTGAPRTAGYVEIRNSRAVTTHGIGPCFQADGKKWIRGACPN